MSLPRKEEEGGEGGEGGGGTVGGRGGCTVCTPGLAALARESLGACWQWAHQRGGGAADKHTIYMRGSGACNALRSARPSGASSAAYHCRRKHRRAFEVRLDGTRSA